MIAAMDNGPCAIDGALFVLTRWRPGLILRNVKPTHALLWVRISGVLTECFNQEAGWKLASIAGDPTEVRTGFYDARNLEYIRARVWVRLRAPLISGFYLNLLNGGSTWVEFQYERVHKICRKCGFIGNSLAICMFNNEDEALEEFLTDHFEEMVHVLGLSLRWDENKELYYKSIRAHAHHEQLRNTAIPSTFWEQINHQFIQQNYDQFEDGFGYQHRLEVIPISTSDSDIFQQDDVPSIFNQSNQHNDQMQQMKVDENVEEEEEEDVDQCPDH